MNISKKFVFIVGILCATIIASFVIVTQSTKENIVYVDLKTVIDSFTYKLDLESEFSKTRKNKYTLLDSLETEIRVLYKKIENEKHTASQQTLINTYEELVTRYKVLEERIDSEVVELAEAMNDQLYTRLNSYIQDFGKINSYKIILGAQGSGLIMYAQEHLEITQEVINYINNTYEGR